VLTNIVKGINISFIEQNRFLNIYQHFIIIRWVGKKSMCVAAEGWLQGRAATLLLLCAGLSILFFLLIVRVIASALLFVWVQKIVS
jgi:hypothetical protein